MESHTHRKERFFNHRAPSLPNISTSSTNHTQRNTSDSTDDADPPPETPTFEFNNTMGDHAISLSIPKSESQQLSVNSDMGQSNLSVIDMYRDANSYISNEEEEEDHEKIQQEDLDQVPPGGKNNGYTVDNTSVNDLSSRVPSTNELATLQSSRQSASRVRLSIEESRTKITSDRDRYGFKKKTNFVTEEDYNSWWMEYSKHCARRKNKWVALMNKNGLSLNNDNPLRFPSKSEKLKRYIRKGIPAEWRGNAWWYFAKGPELLKKNLGVYDSLVESTMNLHNKDTDVIERDLNRTFPDNIHFRPENKTADTPETPLIQALRRVLVAFATYQPSIGYCQSLNFIAGLLLIFMDEERTFWMLVIITSRYLPGVHEINLEGVNIDQGVLMLSIKEFLPDVWQKLASINFDDPGIGKASLSSSKGNQDFLVKLPPITLCTSSWFMSTFIGIMPIETVLRVWDCFFYEESNFLFKAALSIFKLIEPILLQNQDEMEIFQIVQNTPKKIIDPSQIFDIIFKKRYGFNNLNQEEVIRCRKYVDDKRKRAKLQEADYNINGSDVDFNRKLLSESLWQPDLYGFKKGLPGVHWNNNLTRKMKTRIKRNTHRH